MNFIFIYFVIYLLKSINSEGIHLEHLGNILHPITCVKSNGSYSYLWNSPIGPDCWSATFPQCGGKFQSPINIDTLRTDRIYTKKQLMCSKWMDKPVLIEVENTGKTIQLKFEYLDYAPPILRPTPINQDSYQFDSAHIHFIGSEHSFNLFQKYSMEAHLVFFNMKYGSKENASNYKDGLIVIAKFFKQQYGVDADFTFIRHLEEVGTKIQLTDDRAFPLASIFGSINMNFFAYFGSLTTPSCNQAVTFLLDDKPLKISERTVKILSHIQGNEGYMSPNIRPIQPINGRKVYYYLKC